MSLVLDREPEMGAPPSLPGLVEPLTGRELEILGLVCDGWSNQEICERLGIGLPTVKYHLANVFGKLGVRRRTQAVALAVYLRLVHPAWMQAQPPEGTTAAAYRLQRHAA